MALTDKLSAIGNAIRAKTGGTELLTLDAMPNEIASIQTGGGGGGEIQPIVLTGDQAHGCTGTIASTYIDLYGDTITTENITDASYMFQRSTVKTIPFEIKGSTQTKVEFKNMFEKCKNLEVLPKISGLIYSMKNLFAECYNLKNIPDDYFDSLDFSQMKNNPGNYICEATYLFYYCYSLRKIPLNFLNNMNPIVYPGGSYFYCGFQFCYCLDELVDLPIPYITAWGNNAFINTFNYCTRLKRLTFATQEDGSPKIVEWINQIIDLSQKVGYGLYSATAEGYGISKDKEMKDADTYGALKNDPDSFSNSNLYSRYNHDSAVETINSLPDASASGTNTIKFKGEAGSATDGGAINTMTEEEIAVAAAKGWTVTFV